MSIASHRVGPAGSFRRRRRHSLRLEPLEGRTLLTIDFAAVLGLGGANLEVSGTAIDDGGNLYVSGSFFNTVDFDPGPNTVELASVGGRDMFVAKYSPSGSLIYARRAGGSFDDRAAGIAVDQSGAAYVTGFFTGNVDFGSNSINTPGADVFVWKLDPVGTPVFAVGSVGEAGVGNQGRGIDVSPDGSSIAVTGFFLNSVTFGTTPTLTASGTREAFVARLNGAGNFQYARALSVNAGAISQGERVVIDGAGGVISTGGFSGTVQLDPIGGTRPRTAPGNDVSQVNAYVSKFDAAGNFVFGQGFGGSEFDLGTDIAVDGSNNVYTIGRYRGTVDFDPDVNRSDASDVLNGPGNLTSFFVLRNDPTGNFSFVRDLGARNTNTGTAETGIGRPGIGVDSAGNILASASFNGTANIGGTTFESLGGSDVFVARLNNAGTIVEAVRGGGPSNEVPTGLAVNNNSGAALVGSFAGSPTFGTTTLTPDGAVNVFVSRLNVTTDAAGPQVVDIVDVTPDPRQTPVDSVDVILSAPADLASFTFADVTLTRDGQSVPLNNSVTVSLVSGTTYRINGLTGFTGQPGSYTITVSGAGITDPAGNPGSGQASDTFTVFLTGPTDGPVVLQVRPVTPSPRNSPVSSVDVVLSESVNLASFTFEDVTLTRNGSNVPLNNTVTIAQINDTTYRINGLSSFTGQDGSYVLTVSGAGITDPQGNPGAGLASTEFVISTTGPAVQSIAGVTPSPRFLPLEFIDVTLSGPINPASFTFTDVTLTRNGSTVPLNNNVTIAQINETTYRVGGLRGFTIVQGNYQITVSGAGLSDPVGNAGSGQVSESFRKRRVPGDYNGDGNTDLATYIFDEAAGMGRFQIRFADGTTRTEMLGGLRDIPIEGDFDGDGRADIAIFQPEADSNGDGIPDASRWIIILSSTGERREILFGAPGILDRPAPADYTGDGRTDIATFRPNSDLNPGSADWFILPSDPSITAFRVNFGAAGGLDLPASADYTGDGRADIATFRPVSDINPGTADWFILPADPTITAFSVNFGAAGNDQPVVLDYDGDGRDDISAFRSVSDLADAAGQSDWFILQSQAGARRNTFGTAGSLAAPGYYDGNNLPDLVAYNTQTGQWTIRNAATGETRSVPFGATGPNAVPVLAPLAFRLRATGNQVGTSSLPESGSLALNATSPAAPGPNLGLALLSLDPATGSTALPLSDQAGRRNTSAFDLALEDLAAEDV